MGPIVKKGRLILAIFEKGIVVILQDKSTNLQISVQGITHF